MFYNYLLILCLIFKVCSAASDLERAELSPPFANTSQQPTHYPTTEISDSVARTPLNEVTPNGHPILRKSWLAKTYVENSTLCCFLSRGCFQTGAFVASVATCAVAGIAYGVSDTDIKDKLNLALVILTVGSAALKKFENYARAAVSDQEDEYKMFDLTPTTENKKQEVKEAAIV